MILRQLFIHLHAPVVLAASYFFPIVFFSDGDLSAATDVYDRFEPQQYESVDAGPVCVGAQTAFLRPKAGSELKEQDGLVGFGAYKKKRLSAPEKIFSLLETALVERLPNVQSGFEVLKSRMAQTSCAREASDFMQALSKENIASSLGTKYRLLGDRLGLSGETSRIVKQVSSVKKYLPNFSL